MGADDDDQVDIDTYVDGDSQSLRESLQWEVASTSPSPSDSVSTTSSKFLTTLHASKLKKNNN